MFREAWAMVKKWVTMWQTKAHGSSKTAVFHILPIDDLREHDDVADKCWCHPSVERVENGRNLAVIITHNSADGRELVEEHGLQ